MLPIGISFFAQIAFLTTAMLGRCAKRSALTIYGSSLFPHLIAGPILHHSEMMLQFLIGAAKKLLPADGVSVFVAPVFWFW